MSMHQNGIGCLTEFYHGLVRNFMHRQLQILLIDFFVNIFKQLHEVHVELEIIEGKKYTLLQCKFYARSETT